MDSLTHIVVGAVLGAALSRKSLLKEGMILGAVAQSLPDIDFVTALWLQPVDYLLAHRGFTHSLLFGVLAAGGCAWVVDRWYRKHNVGLTAWSFFFLIQLSLHLLIDVMNAYGVGLLEPFSHQRFSLNVLFVADPLFTLWPLIAALAVIRLKNHPKAKRIWIAVGLFPCMIYFTVAVINKLIVKKELEKTFQAQSIFPNRYFSTPTPLNSFLWYIVAEVEGGYYIGYRSVFDDYTTSLKYFPKNDSLLISGAARYETARLKVFSQGYYVIANDHDELIFSDLRFGQAFGWIDAGAPFIFRYKLNHSEENLMVIQKGRFANWNGENLKATLKRIGGSTRSR